MTQKSRFFFIHQKAEEEPRFQNKYFSDFLAVQDSECLLTSAKILFGKWDWLEFFENLSDQTNLK